VARKSRRNVGGPLIAAFNDPRVASIADSVFWVHSVGRFEGGTAGPPRRPVAATFLLACLAALGLEGTQLEEI